MIKTDVIVTMPNTIGVCISKGKDKHTFKLCYESLSAEEWFDVEIEALHIKAKGLIGTLELYFDNGDLYICVSISEVSESCIFLPNKEGILLVDKIKCAILQITAQKWRNRFEEVVDAITAKAKKN